ncbi:protein kinase domain-containing protein [Kitasatospora sp. KL5]|uniref:protein kinase domain-containing protein n=1 Tax=Kitasatospora sp. KL5 TaxID=3425125 RepID=UPI003D6E64FC
MISSGVLLAAEAQVGNALMSESALLLAVGALTLRLATWPLLRRAQAVTRGRARPAREEHPSSGSRGALYADLALRTAALVALALRPPVLDESPFYFGELWFPVVPDNPVARSTEFEFLVSDLPGHLAYTLPLWIACLAAWYFTQRNLHTVGLAAGAWNDRRTRTDVWCVLAVGVFATFLVSIAVAETLLIFNLVALLSSLRPVGATPSTSADATPDTPAPAVAPVRAAVRPAPAATPYVPTQVDRALPTPGIPPYQELRAHEPRTLGAYQLLGRIGAGGMGTVYLARRQGSATQVALKTINPDLIDDPELLRRFGRETEVLAMVPGAYTARVLDSGIADGRPYLAMELLDGRTLEAHLGEQGPFRSPEALRSLALALAVALSDIHRLGLVHRDLKPANVMLTTAGPRLLDFGIATLMDGTRLTRTGMGIGTLTYMAPEQFGDHPVGPAADVWAWACCVICAAHGASPFAAAGTGAVIRRIVETGPDADALATLHGLDPALAAVARRALAIDVPDRFADGAELLSALTHSNPLAVEEAITSGWRTFAR